MVTSPIGLCRSCRLAMPAHAAATAGFSSQEGEIPLETDCLLEGDGFEPSVPRHNKLCVAPATNVPGRDDPLRRQLGSGCKAELDQPTTLRRVRLARTRVWRS